MRLIALFGAVGTATILSFTAIFPIVFARASFLRASLVSSEICRLNLSIFGLKKVDLFEFVVSASEQLFLVLAGKS
jgi:hypothetical protein